MSDLLEKAQSLVLQGWKVHFSQKDLFHVWTQPASAFGMGHLLRNKIMIHTEGLRLEDVGRPGNKRQRICWGEYSSVLCPNEIITKK